MSTMMKVITIHHVDEGGGYTLPADQAEHFRDDMETHLKEFPNEHCDSKDVDSFLESLKELEVGQVIKCSNIWKFTCQKMTEEEYDTLPEWG